MNSSPRNSNRVPLNSKLAMLAFSGPLLIFNNYVDNIQLVIISVIIFMRKDELN